MLQKSVSLMYPILDIGYLGGVFSIFFFCMPKSKFNVSNLLTSIAFLIWFFVDLVYGILSGNTYVSGGILDPLWPIGCWVLALAILYPIDNEVAEYRKQDISSSRRELLWEYIRFLFPYFTVSIIVVLVSYQYILKDPLVTGTVITVLLIVIRQIFSLLENKRLISMIGKSNQLLEESKVELEERNTKLQELNYLKAREANTDFLTGIFNRRYVNEMLKSLPMINPNGKEVEVSVLLIDIDYYKQINDKWGHEVGDSVLKQIAQIISSCTQSGDVVGRYGGDEFIVIMANTDLKSAEFISERLLQKTSASKFLEISEGLKITLSIGCATWKGPLEDYDMDAIVVASDKALYKSKEDGRNRYNAVEVGKVL